MEIIFVQLKTNAEAKKTGTAKATGGQIAPSWATPTSGTEPSAPSAPSISVQLKTKTWRELAVWHKRSLIKDWFEWTATKFYHIGHPETWFTAAIPWSEKNPEAFAGQHGEHVLVIYDESSAIPDIIWEVLEGVMTPPGAMRFAFGNPTRNTGKFRECFGKFKHRWLLWQIDSRDCRMTDKRKLDEWVDDYGEDSDFVKVRLRR